MSNNYDDFLTAAGETDQSAVESIGNKYPVIQWNNGDQKQRKHGGFDYHGGFFVKEEDADLSGVNGWEKVEWMHENGKSTDGFYAPELSFSVIRKRQWWEVMDGNQRNIFSWNDYDKAKAAGSPRGRTQYLVLVKGLEDRGLFMLTLRGMSAVAFDSRKGALSKMAGTVIKSANAFLASKKSTNKMPFYSFWLRVGYSRNTKGEPEFQTVGSGTSTSTVCLPMALDFNGDENMAFEDAQKFFVGRELNAKCGELRKETEEWESAVGTFAEGAKADAEPSKTEAAKDAVAEAAAEYGI